MDAGRILSLHNMHERHLGLSHGAAEYFTEAARVCLDRHHKSPIQVAITDNDEEISATLTWLPCDEGTSIAHANDIDATEVGAYACALASTELTRRLFALRRAETQTGADYYLAPAGTESGDLEECVRLEVSGLDKGNFADVKARLLAKIAQAKAGRSNLPAIAAVVGFRIKRIMMREVEIP